MTNKKGNLLLLLIAVLIVTQAFCLSSLSDMRQALDNAQLRLSDLSGNYGNRLNEISSAIEQQLKEQASIIDSYDFSFAVLDAETLTIALNFSVAPKTVAAGDTATLTVSGQTCTMTRQGDNFVGTLNVPLLNEIDSVRFALQNGDTHRQETIELWLSPREYTLPQMFANLERSGDSTVTNTEETGTVYRLNGTAIINLYDKSNGASGILRDLRLCARVDGSEVWRQEYDRTASQSTTAEGAADPVYDDSTIELAIKQPVDIPLKPDQQLTVSVEAKDDYGLTHRVILDQLTIDENGEPMWDEYQWFSGEESLLDADGNVLWSPEY